MRDDDIKRIEAPVGNYYGAPAVWERDGKFYFEVEDWDGWGKGFEVSKTFFDAFVTEFGGGYDCD